MPAPAQGRIIRIQREPRNYVAEMDDLIREMLPEGTWISEQLARQIMARLMDEDPELLEGWLHEYAVHTLTTRISEQARSAHGHRSSARRRSVFADAAADGPDSMSAFLVIDTRNTRKRISEMTGDDHLFVARRHERRSRSEAVLAAFHEAVAERVGTRRTGDVLSQQEYDDMYQRLLG